LDCSNNGFANYEQKITGFGDGFKATVVSCDAAFTNIDPWGLVVADNIIKDVV